MAERPSRGAYDVSSTAPHAARKLKKNPLWPLFKLGLVIVVPLALLSIYGQPALRVQYTWNGHTAAPVYSRCDYYTAFDGWKIVHPAPGINNCPLIAFFPFHIEKLLGA